MDVTERGYEDVRWMKLALDHVHWQLLVLAELKILIMLPYCQ
jgi:hypothetical protein